MRALFHPDYRVRFRLLPALIFVCIATVGLRTADIVSRIVSGSELETVGSAHAANSAADSAASDTKPSEAKTNDKAADALPDPNKPTTAAAASHFIPDAAFSGAEVDLLQTLSKRREELDRRNAGMQQQEATLKVAEDRIDQKMAELTTLKAGIEKLLDLQKSKQDDQIQSLVKIYSDMKPADAARIFSTLDMPVLIGVVAKMKEQKAAPIIAAMDPDRARLLTSRLADLRQLPDGTAPEAAPAGAPTVLTPAAAAAAANPVAAAAPPSPPVPAPQSVAATTTSEPISPPKATASQAAAEAPPVPVAAAKTAPATAPAAPTPKPSVVAAAKPTAARPKSMPKLATTAPTPADQTEIPQNLWDALKAPLPKDTNPAKQSGEPAPMKLTPVAKTASKEKPAVDTAQASTDVDPTPIPPKKDLGLIGRAFHSIF